MHMKNMLKRMRKYETKKIDMDLTMEVLYDKYDGRCQNCDVKTVLKKHPQVANSATIEHIIPLSAGGNHTHKNATLFCHTCNRDANANRIKTANHKVWSFKIFNFVVDIRIA